MLTIKTRMYVNLGVLVVAMLVVCGVALSAFNASSRRMQQLHSENLVPITQVANGWVMSAGLAISDAKGTTLQLPLDEANDYFADPSGIVVDAAGNRKITCQRSSTKFRHLPRQNIRQHTDHAHAANGQDR